MADRDDVKPHIYLGSTGTPEPFTAHTPGGGKENRVPPQNRHQHTEALKAQLDAVKRSQEYLSAESSELDLESRIGIQVAFESYPGVELAVESLADARQQIELMNIRHENDQVLATVFVPEGKLNSFEKKLEAYLEERRDRNGKPRDNQKLIDAIQSLHIATLEALWTDDPSQWPIDENEQLWWEVWLPIRDDRNAVTNDFKQLAGSNGITVSPYELQFPERTVLLARGARNQFTRSGLLLNTISELRRAKETAAFFDELPPDQQPEWSGELLGRLEAIHDREQTPYICILDTGANYGHPLIRPFLEPDDQFAVETDWDGADTDGHGTGMSGLAVWGDLIGPLAGSESVRINHRLESVKVLRYSGDNEGKHLGIITANGVALPTIENPRRLRIFTMALSSKDGRDRGRPSAWSSEVDSLTADYLGENETPKLFIISAGNTGNDLTALKNYPAHNELQDVHDPGQAWNALTVGAYTEKTRIAESNTGLTALAPTGGLSPYSTTSITWDSMPIKPEVVFEGGNVGVDRYSCIGLPSLKLLTTHYDPSERHFTTFEGTSAATALASRFAAAIYAQYPNLWPETVRGLIVHSARWTETMNQQFRHGSTPRKQAQHRVRCVGFGVPSIDRALWSMSNSLVLIVEDQFQPFEKPTGKNAKTKDMHLHDLPWPTDSLQKLPPDTLVEMTVTLSYFIEPNPSSRNVSGKYSYPSYQLRFDVKRSTESTVDFRKRINAQARVSEEEGDSNSSSDQDWLFGPKFRHKGSVHKDIWTGTAADLAERGKIAIYPAMGWWRSRLKHGRVDKIARYSLIVSISVPEVEVDIYNEVNNKIAIETEIH